MMHVACEAGKHTCVIDNGAMSRDECFNYKNNKCSAYASQLTQWSMRLLWQVFN